MFGIKMAQNLLSLSLSYSLFLLVILREKISVLDYSRGSETNNPIRLIKKPVGFFIFRIRYGKISYKIVR